MLGKVIKNPSKTDIERYNKAKEHYNEVLSSITEGKGIVSVTKDGIPITIGANINKPDDIPVALDNGACIIGLLRTEYFYISRENLPTEDDLFSHYSKLVSLLEGKELTIRLLDIGGDKKVDYLSLPEELNPFLGYRSIRYLIDHREVIIPQLKAILRVSYGGNVKILIPMLATLDELRVIKNLVNESMNELKKDGKPYRHNIPLGAMIEIPSAALNVTKILKEVDFITIGSNDLLQYFMAADRGNVEVANLYNWFNPIFLSLVGNVVSKANRMGKLVGLCGEMGSSPSCLPILLGMGLQRISMNIGSIPIIKKMISTTSFFESIKIFNRIKRMESPHEVESYMHRLLKRNYPYATLFDIYT
jgi:phosphotransferase system enzyme I (PtsI)